MRKNIVAAVVGLGLAAAFVPRQAHAVCSTGAFNICASVQFVQTYTSSGKTHVVLKVWNLGTSGTGGIGQSHVMIAVGFENAGVSAGGATLTGAFFGGWNTSTHAGTGTNIFGNGSGKWKNSNANVSNAVGASVDDALGNTGSGGLIGCNESPHDNGQYATCSPSGNALVLDFRIDTGSWSTSPFLFGWHSGTAAGIQGCSVWVASDGTTVTDQNATCNVVPEPVTMLLLGSGLAGMGGVGLFRRRKKNGDVENA